MNTIRGTGKISEVLKLLSVSCTNLSDSNVHIELVVDTVEGIKAELEEWLTDAGKINS